MKKRLYTVIEPATNATSVVAVGASTFDNVCDTSISPLKVVGFICVLANFVLGFSKTYLFELISANQLNTSRLEILNERIGRTIESTNAMIEVYKRVDQYDGRPGRRLKDDLQGAIPEAFRQYVSAEALQNYAQVKFSTLPPRAHAGSMSGGKDITSGMGSVRRSPFGSHSRKPSNELPSSGDVRVPEKGRLPSKPSDKSNGGSNPGATTSAQESSGAGANTSSANPMAMFDAIMVGTVKAVQEQVSHKPAEDLGAVFIPTPEATTQPEPVASPTSQPQQLKDHKEQESDKAQLLAVHEEPKHEAPKPSVDPAESQPQVAVVHVASEPVPNAGTQVTSQQAIVPGTMSDPQPDLQTQVLRPETKDSPSVSAAGSNPAVGIEISRPAVTSPEGAKPKKSLWGWMG